MILDDKRVIPAKARIQATGPGLTPWAAVGGPLKGALSTERIFP